MVNENTELHGCFRNTSSLILEVENHKSPGEMLDLYKMPMLLSPANFNIHHKFFLPKVVVH